MNMWNRRMKTAQLFVLFLLVFLKLEAADELQWLRAKETRIVNEHDETVILRGINLGGWLVEEMWMMPFDTDPPKDGQVDAQSAKIQDHVSLWNKVEERFGHEKMSAIRKHLRKCWLQASDFDRIKECGFNCVRLPFLYDIDDESEGLFYWLDWAIDEAKKRGIYVILDMHGAPGRQSKEEHTGQVDHNRFFHEEEDQKKAEELWKKIALRYKDSKTVAGFDLLNEPMGAPSMDVLYDVYHRLYKAIREVNSRHIIYVEDGYMGIDHMPAERYAEMDNIVLSGHVYKATATNADEHIERLKEIVEQVSQFQKRCKIPFYLGEFNILPFGTVETVKKYIEILESHHMSWSPWTYKVATNWLKGSLWAIHTPKKDREPINAFHDSEKKMLRKITELKTENFVCNQDLVQAFKTTRVLPALRKVS
jgi:hypothetical protein